MLIQTGERQISEILGGIKENHRQRYAFATAVIKEYYGYAPKSILDSACGNGYGSHMIALAGHDVIGVDVFPDAIECANRAYGLDSIDYGVLDLQDEEAWPFYETRFAAIVSIETIEHVLNPESLVSRFAKSTDLLIATVPNEDVVAFDAKTHPFHHRHYTKEEFQTLIEEAGFTIQGWWTQYDKVPGIVHMNDDGMGFLVVATKNNLLKLSESNKEI